MRFYVCTIAVLFLLVNNALAEHEADHRYNIRGYVLDDQRQAISNQDVLVFSGDSLLARSKTDAAGYYSLHLHLHNEDIGRRIKLRAGSDEAEIRVTFDTKDLTSLRIHDANFVDGVLVEKNLGRFQVPPWTYPLAGLFIIGFILVMLEKRRKKKIRQLQLASTGNHPPSSHKRKKRISRRH